MEVKAFDYGFGGICDDGFKIEEANVVCRQGTTEFRILRVPRLRG